MTFKSLSSNASADKGAWEALAKLGLSKAKVFAYFKLQLHQELMIFWTTSQLGSPAQDVIETWIQFNVVFVNVVIQIFCSQHLGYPHQLGTNRKISHYCEGIIMSEPAQRYCSIFPWELEQVWDSRRGVISQLQLPHVELQAPEVVSPLSKGFVTQSSLVAAACPNITNS